MSGAAFFDLDRTLLRHASGPVLSEAMREVGVVSAKLPLEGLLFGVFNWFGETLPSIALARQAVLVARGREVGAFDEAAELAGERLAERVEPFAHALLEEHRAAGRPVVLATTTPEHLIRPFAERLGLDEVIATRYTVKKGRYTGGIDGPFVWSTGKLAAVKDWAREHNVDLAESFAYSDSIYDLPLLSAVGNPGAVNPDPRLLPVAALKRWPVLYFDTLPGVIKLPLIDLELQQIGMMLSRPETFPFARFHIEGLENVPEVGGAIMAGNHRSYFDLATMMLTMGRSGRTGRFLAKKELFDVPLVGSILRAGGGISVDRQHDDPDAPDPLTAAAMALRGGELVGVMPQGTIPRGPDFFDPVLKGHTGAARLAKLSGAPVIPFAVWGTEQVWPRSAAMPNMLSLLDPPHITVRIGEPVELKLRSAPADTRRIMAAISELLPEEARSGKRPSLAELAETYPSGVVPPEDRAFAWDG
ncbi:HAD-IB family hydrolase [Janibacter sp. GXQ6167]|uniref:HAD-IB family hydrolase n=1 Tax=Janibacter sp. GXQ6167 TaxID=3240791 RepID=UPI00352448B8